MRKSSEGGEFGRDEFGNPNGFINEMTALYYVQDRAMPFSIEDYISGIIEFQTCANRAGITAIHEAEAFEQNIYGAYKNMAKNNNLKMRVRISGPIYPYRGGLTVDEQLKYIIAEREKGIGDLIQQNTVKLFMDGMKEIFTAALVEPYENRKDFYGELAWDLEAFNDICLKVHKEKFQIHVHAFGDRAVKCTLDAFENAEKDDKRDARHMIAHAWQVQENDYKRFQKLGAAVLPSPIWYEKEVLYKSDLEFIGKERADKSCPMKSFTDNGVIIACGSDAPIDNNPKEEVDIFYAPLLGIQMGVTRCSVLEDSSNIDNVLGFDQRLSIEEMIKTYTINGAYVNFMEDIVGSIEVGKYADLIVLSENIFDVPVDDIYKTKVLLTLLEGKEVYKDKDYM